MSPFSTRSRFTYTTTTSILAPASPLDSMPFSTMHESAAENDPIHMFGSESDLEIDSEMCYDDDDPWAPTDESEDEDLDSLEVWPDGDEFAEKSSKHSGRRHNELKMPSMIARMKLSKPKEQYAIRGYTCPRFASIIPPPNFGAVVEGKVYRSGFPTVENLEFLDSLKLRTIVTLVETPHPEFYTEWIRENFKDHHTIPLPPNKEVVRIKTKDMAKVMAIVTDPDNYPLLIHCNKGKHRTGCAVGAFRKCAGIRMPQILSEYHDYASNKARKLDETFLENVRPYELMYPLPPADMIAVGDLNIVPAKEYYKRHTGGWLPIRALA